MQEKINTTVLKLTQEKMGDRTFLWDSEFYKDMQLNFMDKVEIIWDAEQALGITLQEEVRDFYVESPMALADALWTEHNKSK